GGPSTAVESAERLGRAGVNGAQAVGACCIARSGHYLAWEQHDYQNGQGTTDPKPRVGEEKISAGLMVRPDYCHRESSFLLFGGGIWHALFGRTNNALDLVLRQYEKLLISQ
ncbi:hypothetical protein, partial [Alloalcanivorax venustensis]|uniref:hypothetical protein n=1 Tax=Alloalcanivorax venustensis TaxID=172371 RepID=UPI003C6A242B